MRFHVFTDAMAKEIWYNIQIGMKNISSEEWDWNQVNMYAYPRLLWHPELSANSMWAITAGGHMGRRLHQCSSIGLFSRRRENSTQARKLSASRY